MSDVRYVKDAHGHIHIYVAQYHAERIGRGLEFIERPQTVAKTKTKVEAKRSYRTLQELREAAAKVGFDIPDGTPFAKAQNLFANFLNQENAATTKSGDDLSGIGAFDNAGKTTN